jgi:hypothetical protein
MYVPLTIVIPGNWPLASLKGSKKEKEAERSAVTKTYGSAFFIKFRLPR